MAQASLNAAERAADDGLAIRAAAASAFLLSAYLGSPEEGERWTELASTLAERAGHDDATEAVVLHARMAVTSTLGHPEQALPLVDREISLLERIYGDGPNVAYAVMNRGVTESIVGKWDLAAKDFERAIGLFVAASGPNNPHLDLPYANLALALLDSGRIAEARAAGERALALQAGRPPGTVTVIDYDVLARIALESGNPNRAIELSNTALDRAKAANEHGRYRWAALVSHATARGEEGDLAGKAEDCTQVLAEQKAQGAVSRDRLYYPDALACLGEAELAAGRVASAVAYLEQSVSLEQRESPRDLPLAKFGLARALRAAGRDPERARALAESARATLGPMPGQEKKLAAIDSWLKEAPAAPRAERSTP
jgi:tetratricopeptide (TPR) repeat protein